ncbi:MAG: hypothetical protein A2W90_22625 [Bacteroidetes bacterium GWF2_42_66]|nr:MAG: hypothetical protein A2W92_22030 [Bacteroidetes bacterium GWA2_42_15]OFY03126.1 MAG: hypothetical protein A2W89_13405 [Bacteroidetes bacterium GWE2_42_39]OFY45234.1 MAG: hypothetical protein A2W90_22625 [Bacteroidetes bacterium GWF2_42_66]HBL74108.1 RNA polymerase subunit sigma-70 [Prolixibacteraceae bacterium]HCR89525.1 RNA polymerase subunit sigma-70 [Prolixibacteraceae bacterium]
MQEKETDIEKIRILQLKEGSKPAFNYIFQTYNQKLYFFALGYLKSEKEAEEIVQETFLKIWERRDHIDPELSINAYLFKIAFNFIQKHLIRNFKEEELKHNLAGELVSFDDHTANMLNYHFLLQHINKLIDELPPRQKEIIGLRKLEGFTPKEISEKLSLSVKTVEAHLTAALRFLKERLQSEKFDDLLLFALTFRKKN